MGFGYLWIISSIRSSIIRQNSGEFTKTPQVGRSRTCPPFQLLVVGLVGVFDFLFVVGVLALFGGGNVEDFVKPVLELLVVLTERGVLSLQLHLRFRVCHWSVRPS